MSSVPTDPYDSRSNSPLSGRSSSSSNHVPEPAIPPVPSSPTTPASPNVNEPLLVSRSRQPSYVRSPLNPNVPGSRPASRGSMSRLTEESYGTPAMSAGPGGYPLLGNRDTIARPRGSMLLYRLASDADPRDDDHDPVPAPPQTRSSRYSIASDSGQSTFSVGSDSKYPVSNEKTPAGAFLAYAYDPTSDQSSPPDADDVLHDPSTLEHDEGKVSALNIRGFFNVFALVLLLSALVALFTAYPIVTFLRHNSRNLRIGNNVQVNGTGQIADQPNLSAMVDKDRLDSVKTRKGWNGKDYELMFSDEIKI